MSFPRVALFTDSLHEVNGAAHTCRQLQLFAQRRGLPLFSVHSGPQTRTLQQGSVTTLELKRGWSTIPVDVDFGFDPLLCRYFSRVGEALKAFRPDLIHIISPGDFSILGTIWGSRLKVPVVASYHTRLHSFAAARLNKTLRFLPPRPRQTVCGWVQEFCEWGVLKFYRIPCLSLAPNPEIQHWLERGTGRPCHIMRRGVDLDLFRPGRRDVADGIFRLGFVGRLMLEKSVRLLKEVEQALVAAGHTNYRFLIVGQGDERGWLERNLQRVEFTGVLRGEELARAYANMDLFLFPSRTDAFGNVVQEALASGVPVMVTNVGGPQYIVNAGVNGYVAASDQDFVAKTVALVEDALTLRRMRAATRQTASTISWDKVFEDVWSSYEFACRLPQPSATLSVVVAPGALHREPGSR